MTQQLAYTKPGYTRLEVVRKTLGARSVLTVIQRKVVMQASQRDIVLQAVLHNDLTKGNDFLFGVESVSLSNVTQRVEVVVFVVQSESAHIAGKFCWGMSIPNS